MEWEILEKDKSIVEFDYQARKKKKHFCLASHQYHIVQLYPKQQNNDKIRETGSRVFKKKHKEKTDYFSLSPYIPA